MPIYMKIDGINGSATGKYQGWIELESASPGVYRHGPVATGGGANREASAPALSEIVVTKYQDAASTALFRETFNGKGKKVTIHFVQSNSKGLTPSLAIEMENVLITSYNVSGHGGAAASGRPMESLGLSFTKIEYSATPVQASKEPRDTKDRAMWNLATGGAR